MNENRLCKRFCPCNIYPPALFVESSIPQTIFHIWCLIALKGRDYFSPGQRPGDIDNKQQRLDSVLIRRNKLFAIAVCRGCFYLLPTCRILLQGISIFVEKL